jgi:hypothetical protein
MCNLARKPPPRHLRDQMRMPASILMNISSAMRFRARYLLRFLTLCMHLVLRLLSFMQGCASARSQHQNRAYWMTRNPFSEPRSRDMPSPHSFYRPAGSPCSIQSLLAAVRVLTTIQHAGSHRLTLPVRTNCRQAMYIKRSWILHPQFSDS